VRGSTDTEQSWKRIPVLRADDLRSVIPYDAVPVAVEIVEGAAPLETFHHPERAFYVFGPEDGSLPSSVLEWCPRIVSVATRSCMNLGAAVCVVLYDRNAKARRSYLASTRVEDCQAAVAQ
jgi:tRNA(Leu) C34 or U34 (ribose-2'-O)-methylase TrmL